MAHTKVSLSYEQARKMLPTELWPVLDEMIKHYRFASLKHHGRPFVSPKALAEMILLGWRDVTEYREHKAEEFK